MPRAGRLRDLRQVWILLAGLLVLGLTAAAGRTDVLGRFLEPPIWAAVPLAIAAGLVGFVMATRAAGMLRSAVGEPRTLIRGVRLLFLAVAAFAAAAGWLLGSAMPVVVGLVIAAVDIIETTALLLITRPRDDAAEGQSSEGTPVPEGTPARAVPARGESRTPKEP
jgi:hypothetical protein